MLKLKNNIATSENGFIFNPATGDSFTSNPIAAEIINYLKSGSSAAEIKEKLLTKYEVDPNQLERDWEDYMLQLREANLITL
ncbi:MAG: PqqD family protein [Chitinophagaceae bacterium]|nr:MAG: PqqD family protein [Chitinophagaceae bacterium]